jgi:hypothetical protein
MRAIILAVLVAVGIGLVGASNVSAAPANGVAIGENAGHSNDVTQVYWRRGWRGRGWRGGGGWGCHVRRWSGWSC